MTGDPKHLAPWAQGEEFTPLDILRERAEGQQIAGVYYLLEELPHGWQGLGLELTTSDVMILMAVPVIEPTWRARLLVRWITRQSIWTPSMDRVFSQGHGRAEARDFFQRQVQGEVLRGITAPHEPTDRGGDIWLFEFRSGATLRALAEPAPARPWAAELDLQVLQPQRAHFGL